MSNKLHVCHVSTLSTWGGVETTLVDFLANRRNDTLVHHVVSTSANVSITDEISKMGIPIFVPKRRFHYDPTAILAIARWMKKQHIDIVHTRNLTSNCWGGIAAILAGIPTIIGGEHGTAWLQKGILPVLEKWLYHRFVISIANSEASKIMLTHNRNLAPNKIKVIHNGITTSKFKLEATNLKDIYIPTNKCIIGTIGRLDTSKDYFTWLQAAQIVTKSQDNVHFIIVGDGPLRKELENYSHSLKIANHVTFAGQRSDAKLIFRTFDIYVSTSVHESLGNTLIEASYSSKPIIAPNIDGIPEVIENGKTGILLEATETPYQPKSKDASRLVQKIVANGKVSNVKSLSAEELAKTIIHLIDDSVLRNKLGKAGHTRANELFSIEKYVSNLERTYLSFLS